MQHKFITYLITVSVITLLSGSVAVLLMSVFVAVLMYMYNAVKEDKVQRAMNKELNEFLKRTGQLN
jgi:cbb3-type cytochrome oxidase subunit 3